MKFSSPIDYERVSTARFLLGHSDTPPNGWRFQNWLKSRRRLCSPLGFWLTEVNRYTLARRPIFDLPNTPADSPTQLFLNGLVHENNLIGLLKASITYGAVTGSALWAWFPSPTGYQIRLYEAGEYSLHPANPDTGLPGLAAAIQQPTPEGFERWILDSRGYSRYRSTRNASSQWELLETLPHSYGEAPVLEVGGEREGHGNRRRPIFDWLALEIATEIMGQMLSSAANHTYFGGPFLVSPDPEQTRLELLERSQVLSGKLDTEQQATAALQLPAMPGSHETLVEQLWKGFCDHTGISWVPEAVGGDVSSLTIRLLNAKTLATASEVGDIYVQGVAVLLGRLLLAAAIDGRVVGVSVANPETHTVTYHYAVDALPLTPQDKAALLGVVEQLQGVGVSPEFALQEYYTNLNADEIRSIMVGDF